MALNLIKVFIRVSVTIFFVLDYNGIGDYACVPSSLAELLPVLACRGEQENDQPDEYKKELKLEVSSMRGIPFGYGVKIIIVRSQSNGHGRR